MEGMAKTQGALIGKAKGGQGGISTGLQSLRTLQASALLLLKCQQDEQ